MLSLCRLGGHTKEVNSCTFSSDYFVTCSGDKTLRVYSAKTFTELPYSPIKEFKYGVNLVTFDATGSLLATACSDGNASIFQLNDKEYKVVAVFQHSDINTAQVCAFSSQARMLATGAGDGSIALWDIGQKKQIRIKAGHPEGNVYAAAFTPCDSFLLTGSALGDIRMWDMEPNSLLQLASLTQAHDEGISSCGVTCIVFSPTFHSSIDKPERCFLMASSGQDNNIKLWMLSYQSKNLQLFRVLSGHNGPVNSCDFSVDGNCIASVSFDKTVRIWTTMSGDTEMVLDGHSTIVTSVAYSRDGKYIATTGCDKVTTVWRIAGELLSGVPGSSNADKDLISLEAQHQPPLDSPIPPENATPKVSFQTWTSEEVIGWLSNEVKLPQYAAVFKENEIDGAELASLTSEILQKDLGISPLGHRNKIIRGIKSLQEDMGEQKPDINLAALVDSLPQPLQAMAPGFIKQFVESNSSNQDSGKKEEYVWKKSYLVPASERMLPQDRPAQIDKPGQWQNIVYNSPARVTDLRKDRMEGESPDEYLCPISREIMRDPVIAADGFTYERASIQAWFLKGSNLSPMTNKPLTNLNLVPNQTLKSLISQHTTCSSTTGFVEDAVD